MRYMLIILLLTSCSKKFHVQMSNIKQDVLPENCQGIVNLVNTQWLKHKRSDCRFDNGIYKKLETEYGPCLKSMNKSQIILLLGNPDKIENQFYYYYFDEKCTNESRASQKFLKFGFEKDKIYYMVSGTIQSTS